MLRQLYLNLLPIKSHKTPSVVNLGVQIVRFVMEHQPPIVEAEFLDPEGRRQTFVDKGWASSLLTGRMPTVITRNSGSCGVTYGALSQPDGTSSHQDCNLN